jgi:HAMP domain-containing protein
MTKKKGSGIDFPWALIVVILLAVWAVSLAVPRPTVVFHGGPRWIGENMLAGIPVLCAFALFMAFMVHRWQTRDQRKLERLRTERLRAERTQLRIQRELEQKRQTDELKRQLAELERQAAESRRNAKREEAERRKQEAERGKQEMQEAIKREERLREERLHREGLA